MSEIKSLKHIGVNTRRTQSECLSKAPLQSVGGCPRYFQLKIPGKPERDKVIAGNRLNQSVIIGDKQSSLHFQQ